MSEKLVKHIMHNGVISCRSDTPVSDVVRILSDTDIHALVITGDEDELMPLHTSTHMAQALPNGKLIVLPGSGHLSNTEQPAAFHQVVIPFLSAIAEGAER